MNDSDWLVTYQSVGAGVRTTEYTAGTAAEAEDKFIAYSQTYLGNCYGRDSILSVVAKYEIYLA
jgi:hypothetical protein